MEIRIKDKKSINSKENKLSDTFIIKSLLCEYAPEPKGVEIDHPRLSWVVESEIRGGRQTAYQILVSSSKENLNHEASDMWNSERVESNKSVNIVYNGKKLESGKDYYWKVRIWDADNNISRYSNASKFEMGLINPEEWQGEWLTSPIIRSSRAPLFRKEFKIGKNVKRARFYISGIGYYELRINGKKVGDSLLDPGWTDYTKRILYATYNVEEYLHKGSNVIGIILGAGWYVSPFGERGDGIPLYGFGKPQFICQMDLEYKDGTIGNIVSDNSSGWLVTGGPIVFNSIYLGERYDAREEKKDWDTSDYKFDTLNDWQDPLITESPGGVMESQMMEPIKVLKEIEPIKVTNPGPGIFVYDLGQNIAGWAHIKVKGKRGEKVTLKYAEILFESGEVNQENLRTAISTDTYILSGEGIEEFEPRFTYHGFRYVQIEGFSDDLSLFNIIGKLVASSMERVGNFHCSNDLINNIYKNIIWTQMDNRHSIPTDCPQRDERFGWLNDATVRAEGEIYNFDMSRFYPKWINDIKDAQGDKTGVIPDVVPFVVGGRPADPNSIGYLLIPWLLYLNYGNKKILEDNYINLKKWVNYLIICSNEYIVPYSYWGDWSPPIKEGIEGSEGNGAIPANTPGDLISTGYFYYSTMIISEIAGILKEDEDKEKYSQISKHIKTAFNKKYFNSAINGYHTGNQACNAFALYLNLVPEEKKEEVVKNLVEDVEIKNKGHLTTGNQCTKYLLEVLSKYGSIDTAFGIVAKKTYPGWGYMIKKGATTIWERWEWASGGKMNSHNHPMFGSIANWFYEELAGINSEWNKEEQNCFIIKPKIPKKLKYAGASIKTIKGIISSKWEKNNNQLKIDINIPYNCRSKTYIPKSETIFAIEESKKNIYKDKILSDTVIGIENVIEDTDHIIITTGSGKYSFRILYK